MNKEEVPLAFPHKWERDDGSTVIAYGATLRDYFAAKSMQGLLADEAYGNEQDSTASWCYAMADAMLKVREQ